jgi:hypothetical protein
VDWRCPLTTLEGVASNGNLEMLKYLRKIDYNLDYESTYAAGYGHLHVIIWLKEQGYKWNENTCASTVKYNHLNVLRWLRGFDRDTCGISSNETEICPWDEWIYISAIENGNIDVLIFAFENDCDFGDNAYNYAYNAENIEVLDCINKYFPQVCPNVEMCDKFDAYVRTYKNNIQ